MSQTRHRAQFIAALLVAVLLCSAVAEVPPAAPSEPAAQTEEVASELPDTTAGDVETVPPAKLVNGDPTLDKKPDAEGPQVRLLAPSPGTATDTAATSKEPAAEEVPEDGAGTPDAEAAANGAAELAENTEEPAENSEEPAEQPQAQQASEGEPVAQEETADERTADPIEEVPESGEPSPQQPDARAAAEEKNSEAAEATPDEPATPKEGGEQAAEAPVQEAKPRPRLTQQVKEGLTKPELVPPPADRAPVKRRKENPRKRVVEAEEPTEKDKRETQRSHMTVDDTFRESYQPSHILSFKVSGGATQTFFENVKRGEMLRGDYFVTHGGNFDINVEITSPTGSAVFSKASSPDGIFFFTALEDGVYQVTFENPTRFTTKTVAFAWLVGEDTDDPVDSLSLAQKSHVQPIAARVSHLHQQLDACVSKLAYQDVRYARNFETQQSTQSRVGFYSTMETVTLLAVVGLQVMYIRRIINNAQGWV